MKSVLIVTAAVAAITASAAEPLLTPRAAGIKHPVVATSERDPNLLTGYPAPGSRTAVTTTVVATGAKDENIAAKVSGCPMAPKAKGTAACAKHCQIAGK